MSSSLYVSFISLRSVLAIARMGPGTTYRYIDVGGWSPLGEWLDPVNGVEKYLLIGDVCVHQVGPHVIVVWVDNIDLVNKTPLLET
jgi:hypothetical protein